MASPTWEQAPVTAEDPSPTPAEPADTELTVWQQPPAIDGPDTPARPQPSATSAAERSVGQSIARTVLGFAVLIGLSGALNACVGLVYLALGHAVGGEHLGWGSAITVASVLIGTLATGILSRAAPTPRPAKHPPQGFRPTPSAQVRRRRS